MVQYLQNNVIMKWTARFIRFTGWIPLKYGSTTTPPIKKLSKNSDVKPRISHCDSQNLQYKTHPEFWPFHRRIFKTSLYYKTRLILETRRYIRDLMVCTKLCLVSWRLSCNVWYFAAYKCDNWHMIPVNVKTNLPPSTSCRGPGNFSFLNILMSFMISVSRNDRKCLYTFMFFF